VQIGISILCGLAFWLLPQLVSVPSFPSRIV
jgi:hypothetical protein